MTLEDALQKSRQDGIQYGITADAAALKNDADAEQWLRPLLGKPVFFALSAPDGSWTRNISQKAVQKFDYIPADGRTWLNEQGQTVDLSNALEAPGIQNRQVFMDSLVDRTIHRLDTEPLDVYSGLTYLPKSLQEAADELWTPARQAKLIEALVRNRVAIELNTQQRRPTQDFIQQAKEAGCKFGFGTGNRTATELRHCEYGLQMVEACHLDWQHFFVPGAWWPKADERRWPARS
jgi:hypothetical protein